MKNPVRTKHHFLEKGMGNNANKKQSDVVKFRMTVLTRVKKPAFAGFWKDNLTDTPQSLLLASKRSASTKLNRVPLPGVLSIFNRLS